MAVRSGRSAPPWALGAAVLAAPLAAAALGGAAPLDVLRNAAVGGGAVAAGALVGGPVVRWLGIPRLSALDRVLLALSSGTGILGAAILALGAVGLLGRWLVVGATLALAVAAAVAGRPWRVAAAAAREVTSLFRGPAGGALAVAAFVALSSAIALSGRPVADWDSLMYHLRVPQQFLEAGRVFLPSDNPHVAHVGAVHMLYVVARAFGAPQAAIVISALLALALALAVFRAGSRGAVAGAGRLAVAGVAGCTVVAYVAFTPRVDATLALFLFLAHAALVRLARGGPARLLSAAGVAAGVAVATKVHAVAYLAPLALWVLWRAGRGRLRARAVATAAAIAIAMAAPWLVKNGVLLGDPVSPLIAGERIPAWLEADARVRAVAGTLEPSVIASARDRFSVKALLFAPESLSPEPEARWYVWSPLLLAGLWTILATRRALPWAIPSLAYLALLLVRSPLTNLRYLVPALPALSVAAALGLCTVVRRLRLPRWTLATFTVASLLPLARPLQTALTNARDPRRNADIHDIAVAAARRVPEDGRILMLYDARGLPFERPVLQDNLAIAWPLLSRSGHAGECLRELELSHVLLNQGAVLFYASRGSPIPDVEDGSLRGFIRSCLEPQEVFGALVLYRIRRSRE